MGPAQSEAGRRSGMDLPPQRQKWGREERRVGGCTSLFGLIRGLHTLHSVQAETLPPPLCRFRSNSPQILYHLINIDIDELQVYIK